MAAQITRLDATVDGSSPLPYSQWLNIMSPNGELNLSISDSTKVSQYCSELVLAGFVDSTIKQTEGKTVVTSKKPTWKVGASAKISFKKPAAAVSTKVTIPLDDDEDLVNEDDLLDELPDADPAASSDCSKKKRACKDCSCGRAEVEAAADAANQEAPPKSACGNCYKGDAFRCAGCPSLGKPAYDPNQENVQLNLEANDLDF